MKREWQAASTTPQRGAAWSASPTSQNTGECDEDWIGNTGHPLGGGLMRLVFFAIALAIALPAAAQTVNENFDRISGERTIAYTADGDMDLTRPVLTFNASFAGEAPSAAITLAFVSASDRPSRFAACHGIDWSVDGQPLAAGSASHRGRVVDGEMIELIHQDVTPAWAAAISTARDARYRVCRNEYALTPGDIQAFKTIVAKLKNAGLSSRVPQAGVPAAAPATEIKYEGMSWRPRQESSFPSRN